MVMAKRTEGLIFGVIVFRESFRASALDFGRSERAFQAMVAKFCQPTDGGRQVTNEWMEISLLITDTALCMILHTGSSEYEEMIDEMMLSNRLGTSSVLGSLLFNFHLQQFQNIL
jgi:hypothetical protein